VSGQPRPQEPTRPGAWSTYELYGLVLATDFPFASSLPPGPPPGLSPDDGLPDLIFTCAGAPPAAALVDGDLPAPVYTSRLRNAQGESNCTFHRLGELDLLRFPDVGDFYLGADRIVCHLADLGDLGAVEILFLGTVLSCWLERAGVPCLHASAVVAGDHAVGFLSFNGGGKSSLAAAMMHEGCPLLTDDVLAVEAGPVGFSGRSGYPQMRLWPAEADRFCGSATAFERVYPDVPKVRVPIGSEVFGAFDAAVRPLAGFYLPVRQPDTEAAGTVQIEPLSPRDAVIEFVRHSFVAPIVEAAGWQARRLDFFAHLATGVPVKRLLYPSGFEHLSRVVDEVLADLGQPGERAC
jgi:hypothetical protein